MSLPERPPHAASCTSVLLRTSVLVALFLSLAAGAGIAFGAGDILRQGAAYNAKAPSQTQEQATAAAAAAARANAKDALARTTKAMTAAKNLQAAARQAAIARKATNLGEDPNHPGSLLPNVPDGLAPGGLQVLPGGSWQGADAPVQSAGALGTKVTIVQRQQQALLDWQTFNVGSQTNLHFDQSLGGAEVGTWTAFNRVNDPSGSPSQILGSITAAGQVYVINQNGIIFGGGSQVNTHILVASALPLNENLVARGLLNNPDAQFLFSALPQSAGTKGPTPAFTPPPLPASGRVGDVVVQPGATLTAPTTAANVGGRIVLVGANVTNAGTIATPDGQTILAAGLQVGFDAHASSDPSLRGLDVFVGAVRASDLEAEYAGTVTNSGVIDVPRANLTMVGKTVNQLGAINSSTSTTLNGRIDISASYNALRNATYDPVASVGSRPFLNTSTGHVEFGSDSVIQLLPELANPTRAIGTELALRSIVNVQGKTVHFAPNASILAPNGIVTVSAGIWSYVQSVTTAKSTFINSGGQIYLDKGSLINVAGTQDVQVPLTPFLLTVELRGAELADSPLQRNSIFRQVNQANPTITVDLRKTGTYNGRVWYGTPLADLSGYVGLIDRSIGELTTAGGTVNLNAGGSLVIQPGAMVDVSGGWVNYEGGTVNTTRVLHMGRLFDIADAAPDRIYDGIYTGLFTEGHARWGVTKTYKVPWMSGEHYEQPYISGASGGTVGLRSPSVALDGEFYGTTVTGPRQRSQGPTPSTFSIALVAQQQAEPYADFSPTPPGVTFQDGAQTPVGEFGLDELGDPLPLPLDRLDSVYLSPSLINQRGFGIFTLKNSDGDVTVPLATTITGPPKGSITITGANIDVQGSITVPGGALNLTVYNVSPTTAEQLKRDAANSVIPLPDPVRGTITLGSSATLNTAGLIVDDRLSAPEPLALPMMTSGGSVSVIGYNVDLAEGSRIDVSGGVAVSATGQRTYGDAGSIVIKAGQDPNLLAVVGGKLNLGSLLLGYSGAKGGSLTIQAPLIQIGGVSPHPDALLLMPDFFNTGGFSSFSLIGLGALAEVDEDAPADTLPGVIPGVSIAPGTIIKPVSESYVAVLNSWGTDSVRLVPVVKPEGLRTPVSLSFSAPGVINDFTGLPVIRGDMVMGEGSRIVTDGLGNVSLSGNTVAVFGSVYAPGGTITIAGGSDSSKIWPTLPEAQTQALPTVYIAPGSTLSTAGKTVLLPDRWGHRSGFVLPGGTITLSGNILAEQGATLDVSGTTGILDLPPVYLGLNVPANGPYAGSTLVPSSSGMTSPLFAAYTVPTHVDSNGGTINLRGAQALYSAATLLGNAGGPTAYGGSLLVSSDRFYATGTAPEARTPLNVTLQVTQDKLAFAPGTGGIGKAVLDELGNPVQGMGYFAVNTFTKGGFDALTLNGTVQFSGPVTIDARRSVTLAQPSSASALNGGVIIADDAVKISAPYVALGKPFIPPVQPQEQGKVPPYVDGLNVAFLFAPTYGTGSLTVNADLIDVGNLSLQNIGSAQLISSGDIRGSGTFNMAGELLLQAAQIYPATATNFTITAFDYLDADGATKPGTVTIKGNGLPQLPLSAGGTLSIYGSIIQQGGTLRAPMGTINLGWDGTDVAPKNVVTGAALPVTQQLTLLPGSITSVSAVDPLTGQGIVIPYGVNPFGGEWIDPAGLDITAGGAPAKTIRLSAQNLDAQYGSSIDVRGGGDLYAYQFVKGNGGSQDILASTTSFAVIPGYAANFMPYAPFGSTGTASTNLNGEPGYVNSSLTVGDRVYLSDVPGLPAGTYTLLPARYALQAGAFLVTPQSGGPVGTFTLPDGSSLVSGYRYNDLNSTRTLPEIYSRFEVVPSAVVRTRAQYVDFYANTFLAESALKRDAKVPRLPVDAGYLLFQVTQTLNINGDVFARGGEGGRGGLIDISSPQDILIAGPGVQGGDGVLVLDSNRLNSFGADSILVGGYRIFGPDYTLVNARANSLTVDNAGAPLMGPEIILVSSGALTLAPGSVIQQSGSLFGASDDLVVTSAVQLNTVGETLTFTRGGTAFTLPNGTPGDNLITSTISGTITLASGTTVALAAGTPTSIPAGATITLSGAGTIEFVSGTGGGIQVSMGDGTLVRVTSDPDALTTRGAVAGSDRPNMTIGAGAQIIGNSLTLDSTYATTLDATAILRGSSINLNSGQISLQFDTPGALQPTVGLVLTGTALQNLTNATSLSLLSYSSIDIYGTGSFIMDGSLALHAGQIRGFNQAGGTVTFSAGSLVLDNRGGVPALPVVEPASGSIVFTGGTVGIGANPLHIDQFSTVTINATNGMIFSGNGGLMVQQDLVINTPLITAARSATQQIIAGGSILMENLGTDPATVQGGLGGSLMIQGTQITANSDIYLPSGLLTLHATTGNVIVGGSLDVSGTEQAFYDVTQYTHAGEISLIADLGSVEMMAGSMVNVAAHVNGGNAGLFNVEASQGTLTLGGTIAGQGGVGGVNGMFSMDVGSLASLTDINSVLEAAMFTESRNIRVRTGDLVVDGIINAHNFTLTADGGSITVNGTINASGVTGGTINLAAWRSIILGSGSLLDASGDTFDSAGKGGAITLEAGSSVLNGGVFGYGAGAVLDIQTGSVIDLSVAANTAGSAALGQFTGTLHLRTPRNAANNNIFVNSLNGTITDASSIIVEGYRLYDLTGTAGIIQGGTVAVPGANLTSATVRTQSTAFFGVGDANYNNMMANLLLNKTGAERAYLENAIVLAPGVEIVNRTGNIVLGSTTTTAASDWNLGTFRFGPKSAPGVLTMRAGGDLIFYNALQDGFDITNVLSSYNAELLAYNSALPGNAQSWSYRLAAGVDFRSADFRQVMPVSVLDLTFAGRGSLLLGKNGGLNTSSTSGLAATTASAINAGTGRFQVIRTGTGNIEISVGRNVQLLNQFASIYTVGALLDDPTMGGTFDVPSPSLIGSNHGNLGSPQQLPAYPAQYTMGGGNVTISAGADIFRQTRNLSNVLVDDSERQLPMNWLYRRGYVDPVTGLFGVSTYGDVASTTWWVDFSNFFEGVGALGGGNIKINAGNDIENIDALIPTNARMPGKTTTGEAIAPDAGTLVELGGGDLTVKAGRNIDGGVYYIERGTGVLSAGGSITTNATRSPSLGILRNPAEVLAPETWLPTTLFLGKGGYDVSARGDLLLGPVVNPFLLPQGYNNSYYYKTYFSTYAPTSYVNATSLGGNVTFRESVTNPSPGTTGVSMPILQAFMRRSHLLVTSGAGLSASNSQPWLRLAEDNLAPFSTVMTLMAPTLRGTSFSGDINLVGEINLSPSATGTVEMLAAGSFNALQPNGTSTINGLPVTVWTSGKINLSDANPGSISGVASPFAYQTLVGTSNLARSSTSSALGLDFLSRFNNLFEETGSYTGSAAVSQTKQALHSQGLLHKDDPNPLRIYTTEGDISGLTLFSPKPARIVAGQDVSDIAFYIQNLDVNDISVVSAGRDIIPSNLNSALRAASRADGNGLSGSDALLSGDIQISGPGTLEVLAGRHVDLGSGPNNADGTGVGITSVGNARNPYLPFEGANLIIAAGLGGAGGLDSGALDFNSFIDEFIKGPDGARYLTEYASRLTPESTGTSKALTPAAFALLSEDEQRRIALEVFFLVLRDAGRDHNIAGSPGFGNYDAGFAAIDALFPGKNVGDIKTQSRDIRTKSGGNISLLVPGGSLTLQTADSGGTLIPPGIITETGGNINVFTDGKVDLGVSRIFTLRGGDIIMWSSTSDIAAGASSKTVKSAPPTRVLIDPQSADISTDLAGLATGGGIGVLATVKNVPPGNVDLIAPLGTVDAGDAGIRATGNLNIAAAAVLNASNISVGGSTAGAPSAPVVAAPNIGGLTAASSSAGASTSAATEGMGAAQRNEAAPQNETPSIITVEVLGYGGGTAPAEDDEDEEKRRRKQEEESGATVKPAVP